MLSILKIRKQRKTNVILLFYKKYYLLHQYLPYFMRVFTRSYCIKIKFIYGSFILYLHNIIKHPETYRQNKQIITRCSILLYSIRYRRITDDFSKTFKCCLGISFLFIIRTACFSCRGSQRKNTVNNFLSSHTQYYKASEH